MPSNGSFEPEHRYAPVNGIRMHYVEAGEGEPVVLLHGFPEFWYSWRKQLPALAPHYRVVAPDLRGYHETEARPPYDTGTLQGDVLGLIEALGEEGAHIVGHDWGGAIAWQLAMNHPESVRSLAILNIPHPALFVKGLRSFEQLRRSWYMFFFQLPWLPEQYVARNRYRQLAQAIFRGIPPGEERSKDVAFYRESWETHGLSGGINWYRALFRSPRRLPDPVPTVTAPTTMIWGEEDVALGKELTVGTERYVRHLDLHYLPGVGHFVQQEAAEQVNELLLAHLARAAGGQDG
ncbi:MAG: alpha/beta hydrolase [Dehalococcoidia bacterium]|nr:alpha/beta hydrolase [Dehalococcoidia bacterium]MYA52358.1 alpha/beta hydrolase [Dehalococcoidia bacterium]